MLDLKEVLDIIPDGYIVNVFHAVNHQTIDREEFYLGWKVVLIRAPRRKQIDIYVI